MLLFRPTQLISDRDKQHRAITLALGGLYPAPEVVHAILAPENGIKKRILDLGECCQVDWHRLNNPQAAELASGISETKPDR